MAKKTKATKSTTEKKTEEVAVEKKEVSMPIEPENEEEVVDAEPVGDDDEVQKQDLIPAEEAMQVLDSAIQKNSGTEMIRPLAGIEDAVHVWQEIVTFIQEAFVYGLDWGVIEGINKPMLFKSGAERVKTWFGFVPVFETTEKVLDWTGKDHGSPFFFYEYKCVIYWGNHPVGEAIGSCNNWEKKYRYRIAELVCPNCGAANIRVSKNPPRGAPAGTPPAYYCWAKTGGCSAEFAHDDIRITEQERGKIENPDPAEQVNTISKMAQKRAFVSAVVMAAGIGGIFTVDAEDFYGIKVLDATTKVPVGTAVTSSNQASQGQQFGPAVQGLGKRNPAPVQASGTKTSTGAAPKPVKGSAAPKQAAPSVSPVLQTIMDTLNVDLAQAAAISNAIGAPKMDPNDVAEAAKNYILSEK